MAVGAWEESVCATAEHLAGQWGDEWKGLGVEIPEDGIGFPAPNELDDVFVDACTE